MPNLIKSKLVYNSLIGFFNVGLSKILGAIILPLLAIYLTEFEYGKLTYLLLICSISSLLLNLGFVSSSIQLFHLNDNQQKKYFVNTFKYYTILSVILFFGILFFFKHNIDFDDNYLLYSFIVFTILIGALSKNLATAWKTVTNEYAKIVKISVLTSIITFIITLSGIYIFDDTLIFRLIALSISGLIFFILAIKYFFINFHLNFDSEHIKLSLKLIPAIFGFELLHYIDQFLISEFLTLDDLGRYSFNYRLIEIPFLILLGFKQVWKSDYFLNFKKNNFRYINKVNKIYVLINIIFSIIILSLIRPFFSVFNITGYEINFSNNIFITLGLLMNSLSLIYILKFSALQKFKYISLTYLICGLINAFLNIYLLPIYGILGASFSTFFSYTIMILIFKTLLHLHEKNLVAN